MDPVTPAEVVRQEVSILRSHAVLEGITLHPLTKNQEVGVVIASRLWAAALGADRFAPTSRYGAKAQAVADAILLLAAGQPSSDASHLRPYDYDYDYDEPSDLARPAPVTLLRVEEALIRSTPLLDQAPLPTTALTYALGTLGAAKDHVRLSVVVEVLDNMVKDITL